MRQSIDDMIQQQQCDQQDNESMRIDDQNDTNNQSMNEFVDKLPKRQRLLYGLMPERDRRQLNNYLKHKCQRRERGVQTMNDDDDNRQQHVHNIMTTSGMQTTPPSELFHVIITNEEYEQEMDRIAK